MNKYWIPAFSLLLLAGCGIPAPRHSIPVVDAQGRPIGSAPTAAMPQSQQPQYNQYPAASAQPQPEPVQVIPQPVGSGLSVYSGSPIQPVQPVQPIQPLGSIDYGSSSAPVSPVGVYPMPAASAPTTPGGAMLPYPIIHQETQGQPDSGTAAAMASQGTQLAGTGFQTSNPSIRPLLDSASSQQASGNIVGAMANLERARLIAPNDPVTLYRLGELQLSQGNPQQAEQMARNAINHAGNDQALTASLWELVARCRDQLGDAAGAADARQKARVIQ